MRDFVFTSPGYKFRERDLSFVTRNVGITTAGIVGEFPQGPAFEAVYVDSIKQHTRIFGDMSNERDRNGNLKYQAGFAAKAFLSESDQLWVTRVLGLDGYDAGKAWGITINAGYDKDTIEDDGVFGTTTTGFTNGVFTLTEGVVIVVTENEQKGNYVEEFERDNNIFKSRKYDYEVTSFDNGSGEVEITITNLKANPISEYDGMVVAILRSKGSIKQEPNKDETYVWETNSIELDTNYTETGDLFANFKVTIRGSENLSGETHVVSLNPKHNFIANVFGTDPFSSSDSGVWVESIYPELITKLYNEKWGYSVRDIVDLGDVFSDYKEKFQTPETPWVVSEFKGDKVDKLFKFYSISDGDAANKQIKISIQNIDFNENSFDVVIRDYFDKDNSVSILESFNGCDLNPNSDKYLGKRIGTTDGYYTLKSDYIMVEIADGVDMFSLPSGFEGYKTYDIDNHPQMLYNLEYSDLSEPKAIRNEFLGISERAYSSRSSVGNGIDNNFYSYIGKNAKGKTKGFHLDSDLRDSDQFIAPSDDNAKFQRELVDNKENPYSNIGTRKFTLVPAGGFDGWNIFRTERTNGNNYRKGGIYNSDVDNIKPTDHIAWINAISTFSNPEEVTINLLATPGINWNNHSSLVKYTIDMVETDRTDTLYVIDSPDIDIPFEIGLSGNDKIDVRASKNVVDLLDLADIDSNYACTYFPWVQVNSMGDFIYIPPTGEVLKSMAITDKVHYPWFAVAGLNRGVINVRKAKYRLSLPARDILYKGRINPIAEFADVGTAIFGQKTLQVKDTALTRINVRRLLLQIKVLIANIAIRMVFEQGDSALMEEFLRKVNPILNDIRKNRGLLDFRVKMDNENNTPETLDRNELYGEIFLKPTRAIEYIGMTFTVTPSGASFEDFGA